VSTPAGCVDGVLSGRYRLDERIAVGGMGEVWRAQDTVLGREVAVKCLRPEYVDDAEFRERFRAEARHAAGLSHPGIASVFDYGEQVEPEKAAWLVMELVEGEPLSALLRREGRLQPAQAMDIVGQAAMALEAAHVAGVVHRDVKPGNLLVRPDGVIKVTDFGIARATDAVPLTRTGTVVGTAYYLSPEQASGGAVTPASDVYSLGVVAYECLAGQRPFPGDNAIAVATAHIRDEPPSLPEDIPVDVRELVISAMQKDPDRRPAHAGEFGRTAMALRSSLAPGDEPATMLNPTVPTSDMTRALTTVTPVGSVGSVGSAPSSLLPPRPVPRSSSSPGRNHRRAVRLASALLAVVVLGLSLRACGGDETTLVPTVAAGSTVEAATTALEQADLKVDKRDAASATVAAGKVIGTDPKAGTKRPAGDTVALLVSTGRPKVSVVSSAYVGKRAADVSTSLTKLGLKPVLAYDGSGASAGTVTSVTPSGSLAIGSTVTVHVVPAPRDDKGDEDRGRGKGKDD